MRLKLAVAASLALSLFSFKSYSAERTCTVLALELMLVITSQAKQFKADNSAVLAMLDVIQKGYGNDQCRIHFPPEADLSQIPEHKFVRVDGQSLVLDFPTFVHDMLRDVRVEPVLMESHKFQIDSMAKGKGISKAIYDPEYAYFGVENTNLEIAARSYDNQVWMSNRSLMAGEFATNQEGCLLQTDNPSHLAKSEAYALRKLPVDSAQPHVRSYEAIEEKRKITLKCFGKPGQDITLEHILKYTEAGFQMAPLLRNPFE